MSDHRPQVDAVLIDRYLAGECSLVECRVVEQWAAADAAHQQQLTDARFIRERTKHPIAHYDASPVWRSWLAHLRPASQVAKSPALLPIGRRWTVVATCAIAVVLVGVGLMSRHRVAARAFSAGRQYATQAAERRTILLTDGTQVTLAPESRLRIADDYGRHARQIELKGEAYFTVVHDAARPFTVRTAQTTTRDIGTAFDIKAYPEDVEVRIAVAEGAVAVTRVECAPTVGQSACTEGARQGDVAFVDDRGVTVAHAGDVTSYLAWMQGRLVFDGVPLHDVVHDLERTFGLQITIADSVIGRQQVTGNFDNVPVDQVLDEITRMIGARFEHHGRSVIIGKRSTGAARRDGRSVPPLTTALVREPAPPEPMP